jgi:MCP family monocarboxylic acid transporter-like MFS transporter 10
LNERIGFRTIAFIGGVLCGLGLLLTSFVTEFYKLFVTYSILWGIGSSLCYFSTLTVAGEYFCRKLSLVNGIITAGMF